MEQQIICTERGPIECRLEGSGPAVLVLQGGHCSRATRLSHERLASAGYTVITPSRPGYDSTPSSVGRTAQAAADALAALMVALQVPRAAVIGISAAGPTALALTQRHPERVAALVLESAMTLPWEAKVQRAAGIAFGRAERVTWSLLKTILRLRPDAVCKMMLKELTTLPVATVWQRMSNDDKGFVRRMLETSQSGTGFLNDLGHHVDNLGTIQVPTLALFSPHDKAVPPLHAQHVGQQIAGSILYETPADSHLIWIGGHASDVWERRLQFLRATS